MVVLQLIIRLCGQVDIKHVSNHQLIQIGDIEEASEDDIRVHVQGDDVFVIYGSSQKPPESLESHETPIPNESLESLTQIPSEPLESLETQIPLESLEQSFANPKSIENPISSESMEYLKSLESLLSSAESFQSFEPDFLEALESLKSSQSSNNPLPTTYKAVVRPDAIKTYRAGSEDSGNYISSRWTHWTEVYIAQSSEIKTFFINQTLHFYKRSDNKQ